MALSRVKTWGAEVLSYADLNAEFNNLLNNPVSLISPLTAAIDMNGFEIILDADADTSITSDTDDRIDFRIGGADGMLLGLASGNTGAFLHVDAGAFTATAATDIGLLRIGNTNAVTVPAGVTAIAAGLYIETPNWTATGTITASATLYIEGAATEGSDDYALWVDAGNVRLDGTLIGDDATDSTSITTGAFQTDGGLGVAKALWVGGLANVAGAVTLQGALIGDATTDSTSIITGAFQTDGGLGVAKALWVGGLMNVAGNTTLQGTVSASNLSGTNTGDVAVATAAEIATGTDNTKTVSTLGLATKTLSYVGNTNDDTDLTTYTFSAHSIGTAAYNRCVHVAIHGNGGSVLVSSVTIAGITAELNANALNGAATAAIASVFVASGTTADIVVTFAGGQLGCRIGVWTSTGLIHTSAISASSTADPATSSLTSTATGFCLAATSKNSADSMTWSIVTERYDVTSGENRMGSGADATTDGTAIAPSGDYATGAGIGVFATF